MLPPSVAQIVVMYNLHSSSMLQSRADTVIPTLSSYSLTILHCRTILGEIYVLQAELKNTDLKAALVKCGVLHTQLAQGFWSFRRCSSPLPQSQIAPCGAPDPAQSRAGCPAAAATPGRLSSPGLRSETARVKCRDSHCSLGGDVGLAPGPPCLPDGLPP